ncbi:TFIIH basal transcription factor complex helicase XPB subunit [Gurleya vavrai]
MFDDILPRRATRCSFTPEEIFLKPNPDSHPFYVAHDTLIFLQVDHPLFSVATDFLIAIAEPVTRAVHIHEYRLTPYSLYAAVSVGLCFSDIMKCLERFSKNIICDQVVNFIRRCTISYGKIKLVIKMNNYFLEPLDDEVRKVILEDEILKEIVNKNDFLVNNVERVKKRCIEIDYPLIEEYDFRSCLCKDEIKNISNVHIDLYKEFNYDKYNDKYNNNDENAINYNYNDKNAINYNDKNNAQK